MRNVTRKVRHVLLPALVFAVALTLIITATKSVFSRSPWLPIIKADYYRRNPWTFARKRLQAAVNHSKRVETSNHTPFAEEAFFDAQSEWGTIDKYSQTLSLEDGIVETLFL